MIGEGAAAGGSGGSGGAATAESSDASASSQFVSALLLTGARFDEGLTVRHVGPPIPSEPHVTMTVDTSVLDPEAAAMAIGEAIDFTA